MSKFYSLISPLISSEVFKYWKAIKLTGVDMSFPKFLFSLESSKFIIGNHSFYCFPWSDSLATFIFEKISAKYPNQNTTVCHSFKEKWCSPKNMISSIPKSNSGTKVLSQNNNVLSYTTEVLYGYFSFITWSIKKIFTQGRDLIKVMFHHAHSQMKLASFFLWTNSSEEEHVYEYTLVPLPWIMLRYQ